MFARFRGKGGRSVLAEASREVTQGEGRTEEGIDQEERRAGNR